MTCPNCEKSECACIVDTAKLIAENKRLREALEAIVDRSENGTLGTSKVLDMKKIASTALQDKSQ